MQTKDIAIIAVTVIVCTSVACGFDGVIIASGMAVVAGLAGYEFRIAKERKEKEKEAKWKGG